MATMALRKKPGLSAEQRAKVFKALSDPRRLEIVDSLAKHGAQCGTQLAEELGVSLALLCHHWEVLAEAGLVRKERVGQLRVCTLDLDYLRAVTGGWSAAPQPAAKTPKTQTTPTPRRRAAPRRRAS
jgi:DNA-binding transcriptional ArsR family regulator